MAHSPFANQVQGLQSGLRLPAPPGLHHCTSTGSSLFYILALVCSLSLLPLPTSVPCSCLLPGSTCRKGAGVFVMSSLAIWSGSSMETKPQTHSTHPLTCCATYPAAKTCSHRCLSANTLAFLNTFQSHSKETNHERKDVSSPECIMSP